MWSDSIFKSLTKNQIRMLDPHFCNFEYFVRLLLQTWPNLVVIHLWQILQVLRSYLFSFCITLNKTYPEKYAALFWFGRYNVWDTLYSSSFSSTERHLLKQTRGASKLQESASLVQTFWLFYVLGFHTNMSKLTLLIKNMGVLN